MRWHYIYNHLGKYSEQIVTQALAYKYARDFVHQPEFG